MKNKNKNSHWLTQPKRPSTNQKQSNQSDYSMTSWVMTSAPETKHPSRSSLCSFLSNEFKDTERKQCSGISATGFEAWSSLSWSITSFHHICKNVTNSYNCTFVFAVFDTFCIFRWIGFAFQDWSSSTLHTVVHCIVKYIILNMLIYSFCIKLTTFIYYTSDLKTRKKLWLVIFQYHWYSSIS